MDGKESFGHRASGQDFTFSSSNPTVPSIPTRLFGSLKFDSRDSPNSPFSTHFDSEQYSSTENLSGASPSCNSSIENSSSTSTPFLQNAMGSDGGENVTNLNLSPNPNPVGQGSGSWSREPTESHTGQSLPSYVRTDKRHKVEEVPIPPVNLKELLIECAKALSENKLDDFEKLIDQVKGAVSITGEPIQRLGAYMIEGLVAKKEETGNCIYRALNCKEPEGKDLLSYMQILYEICPYLKFGYMAANGAIAEACKNEDRIHIIDFQIAQGTQWSTLLRALAARPSGAPYVRITGIDDLVSKYARGSSLEAVGKRLAALSEEFNIQVEFNPIPVFGPDVTKDMLDVRPGEALAVNFPLQLHHTPDESVDVNNPRDGLLRMVRSLSPKVTTLVEQESNTNTAPFLARFEETLKYYFAIFESIDVTMERDRRERINVEQHCLARDIVNIIACEGKERVERHELLGKWKSRLMMAGFRQYPLSSYVNSVIRGLVGRYSEHYTLVEKDGALLLGWKDRNLISASAWH